MCKPQKPYRWLRMKLLIDHENGCLVYFIPRTKVLTNTRALRLVRNTFAGQRYIPPATTLKQKLYHVGIRITFPCSFIERTGVPRQSGSHRDGRFVARWVRWFVRMVCLRNFRGTWGCSNYNSNASSKLWWPPNGDVLCLCLEFFDFVHLYTRNIFSWSRIFLLKYFYFC